MIRKTLDILFTTLIFTLIFYISYEVLVVFEIVSSIKWYTFFLIGFFETILFRIFGKLIGANATK